MAAAVVSSGKDCKQLTPSKPLKAIHYTLVSPQNKLRLVIVQELLYSVWSELHNIASAVRVSYKIWLDTEFLIVVCGITPQNVYHKLLLWS